MSFEIQRTLSALEIGDYFVGLADVVWKVVAKRADGYVGIQNAAGEQHIVKPEHAQRHVKQVIYGYDSLEAMEAAAIEAVGGTVLATKDDGGPWVMPSLDTIYADETQLRAHLLVHHDIRPAGEQTLEDFIATHRGLHADDAPHEHAET